MRKLTIQSIAIIVALLSGAIMAVSLFLLQHYNVSWLNMVITTVVVIGAIYLFTFVVLLKVVVNQITPIYKTIYSVDTSKKSIRDSLMHTPIEVAKKEVKEWAEQKQKELSLLYDQERYRREFVGNVSHELKTPIFNIQGYILTLLDGAVEDPQVCRKYLERTEKSVNRLITIIEDLDSITRLESNEVPLNYGTFDIVRLVEETLESLEITAKRKNIKLSCDDGLGEPIMVVADRQKISQVIINLVVNSITYGRENGSTHISFSLMPERVLVEVADNGVGIDKKDLPRIFERFYRADKHRSRESGGSGLGLAIVKHIIEVHEQSINVRSALDKGSTFAFTLKKAAPASAVRTLFTSNG